MNPEKEVIIAQYFLDHPTDGRLSGEGDTLQARLGFNTRENARRVLKQYYRRHREAPQLLDTGKSKHISAVLRGRKVSPRGSTARKAHIATLSVEARKHMTQAANNARRKRV